MGLAFGVVSGLGPVAGLYSAICAGLFTALFGGTPTQISGPTGPLAILMGSIVVSFAAQPLVAFAVVVLAGFIQMLFGIFRLGRYINLMPYPVISGFATAVGCIIIVMQLNPMLGQSSVADTLTAVRVLPQSLLSANLAAILIAVVSFSACQWMPDRMRRIVPTHLAVLVTVSILVALSGIDIPYLMTPPSLFPRFMWPPWTELPWGEMWVAALVLALISSLDSLLTSISADSVTQQFHDSDRELVGQGMGNITAGFIGALPGAGSTFRTMANIRAGGKTPLSGIVHSVVLLVLLLTVGSLIRFIPASVLAGILIYIGLGIIDWSYIKRFLFAPRGGVLIMLAVWFIGLFINVVTAVAVGVIMASLAFVKRMADLQLESIDATYEGQVAPRLTAAEQEIFQRTIRTTLLIPLSGPLTFGAANGLSKRLSNIARYRAVILEFSEVPHVDESAIVALESIIRRAQDNHQSVILVGLRSPVVRSFVRFGLLPLIRQCTRFQQRLDALRFAARIAEQAPS